jgi:hypothetical protein
MSKFVKASLIGFLLILQSLVVHAKSDTFQPKVKLIAGTGMYFSDLSCMNRWFAYYNYPTLPSGSGMGLLGINWEVTEKWSGGFQISQSNSGVQRKSGYGVSYQSAAFDVYAVWKVIRTRNFSLGPVGGFEFRALNINVERAISAKASLDDLLSQSNNLSSNSGAILRNSARNLHFGICFETNFPSKRTQTGIRILGSGGSGSRWQMNDQILYDSPRNGIRGIQAEAFLSFRL